MAAMSMDDAKLAKLEDCMRILGEDSTAAVKLAAALGGGSGSGVRNGSDAALAAWRYEKEPVPGVHAWSRAIEGSGLRKFLATGVLLGASPEAIADLLWNPSKRLAWDKSYTGNTVVERFTGHGIRGEDDVSLAHLQLAPVLIVSARDFVTIMMKRPLTEGDLSAAAEATAAGAYRPGSIASIAYGAPDPRVPPVSGYVRGEVLPGSAWLLTPVYAGTDDEASPLVQAAKTAGPLPAGWSWPQPGQTVGQASSAAAGSSGGGGSALIGTRMTYVLFTDLKGWVPHAVVNAAVTDTFGKYYGQLREVLAKGGVAKA